MALVESNRIPLGCIWQGTSWPRPPLDAESFESTVADNHIVFVDFWAAWCSPCRQFAPTFERPSRAHSDLEFGKVDTEAQRPSPPPRASARSRR
ncbi:MAG: thioredoxin family protein [Nocardioidaceae bacterium]